MLYHYTFGGLGCKLTVTLLRRAPSKAEGQSQCLAFTVLPALPKLEVRPKLLSNASILDS